VVKLRDWDDNNCLDPKFLPLQPVKETQFGGWSFNATTNKLTLIFEWDQSGASVVEAWDYNVIQLSTDHFLLMDDTDPAERNYMRLERR
jgi:hypothetical protein